MDAQEIFLWFHLDWARKEMDLERAVVLQAEECSDYASGVSFIEICL